VSNGEEIVVRSAMKPLPTLMKPLASVDLETGEQGEALVERSDVAASRRSPSSPRQPSRSNLRARPTRSSAATRSATSSALARVPRAHPWRTR
jgi:hypothetical protein